MKLTQHCSRQSHPTALFFRNPLEEALYGVFTDIGQWQARLRVCRGQQLIQYWQALGVFMNLFDKPSVINPLVLQIELCFLKRKGLKCDMADSPGQLRLNVAPADHAR